MTTSSVAQGGKVSSRRLRGSRANALLKGDRRHRAEAAGATATGVASVALAVFFTTNAIPEIAYARRLEGFDHALVGLLQALLILPVLVIALMPVGIGMHGIGLPGSHLRTDALIGDHPFHEGGLLRQALMAATDAEEPQA